MPALRKILLSSGGAILVLVAVGFLWITYQFWNDPFNDRRFDSEQWTQLSGSTSYDNPRGPMAASLIEYLEGHLPTREEVISLLGPSEYPCGALDPPLGSVDTCLSYAIGAWSGMRMDNDTLDVYFGANGRVAHALTVQH